VKFKVYGSDERYVELEAIVDTSATFTKIPESVASELGLQVKYETEVELGDKRIVRRGLALGEVEIENVRRPVLIAIGKEGERAVISLYNIRTTRFQSKPYNWKA